MKRKRNSAIKKNSPDMVLHRTYHGSKPVPVSSATQGIAHKLRALSVPIVDIRKDNLLLNLGLEDQGHGVWRFNANLQPKRYHRQARVKESKEEIGGDGKPLGRRGSMNDPKLVTDNGLGGHSVVGSEGRKRGKRRNAAQVYPIVIDLSSDEENVCESSTWVKDKRTKLNSLSSDESEGKKDYRWVKDNIVDRADGVPEPKTRNSRNQASNDSPSGSSLNLRGKKLPQIRLASRRNEDFALPLGSNGAKKNSKLISKHVEPPVKGSLSKQKSVVEKIESSVPVGKGRGQGLQKKVDENSNKKKGKKCEVKLLVPPDGGARKRKIGKTTSSSIATTKVRRVQRLLLKKSKISNKSSSLTSSQPNSLKLKRAVTPSKKSPVKSKRSSGSKKNTDRDYRVSPSTTANGKTLPKLKLTRMLLNKSQMQWCEICGAELDSLDNKLEHEFRHQEPRQLLVLLHRCYLNNATIKLPIYVSSEDLAAIPDPQEDTSSPITSDDEAHPRFSVEDVLNDEEENAYESYSSSDDELGTVEISAPLGVGGTQDRPPSPLGATNRVVVLVDAATSPFTTPERGTPIRSPRSVGSKERSKRKSQVKMRLWEGPPVTRSGRVVRVTQKTKDGMEQSSCVRVLFTRETAESNDCSSLPTGEGSNTSGQLIADLNDVSDLPNAEGVDVSSLHTAEGADVSSLPTDVGADVNSLPTTDGSDATSFVTAECSDASNLPTMEDSDGNDLLTSEGDDQVKEVHEEVGSESEEKQIPPVAADVDVADMKGDVVEPSIADTAMANAESPDMLGDVELRLEEDSETGESSFVENDADEKEGRDVSKEKIDDKLEETKNTSDEGSKDDTGCILEENSQRKVDGSLWPIESIQAPEPSVGSNDALDTDVESSAKSTNVKEDTAEKIFVVEHLEDEKGEGSSLPAEIVNVNKKEGESMGKEEVTVNELDSVPDMNQNIIHDIDSSGASEKQTDTLNTSKESVESQEVNVPDGLEDFTLSVSDDMIEEKVVNDSVQESKLSDPEDLETVHNKDPNDLMADDKIGVGQMLEDTIDESSKDVMLVDEGNDILVGGAMAETVEMQESENEFIGEPTDIDLSKFNMPDDQGLEDISDDEWTDISDKEMQQSPQFAGGNLGDVEMDEEGSASAVDNLVVEGAMDLEETEKDASRPGPMCTGDAGGENLEEEMKDMESAEDAMMAENVVDAVVGVALPKDDMAVGGTIEPTAEVDMAVRETIEPTAEVDMAESGDEPEGGCTTKTAGTILDEDPVELGEKIAADGLTTVEGRSDAVVSLDLLRKEETVNAIAQNVSEPECQVDKNVLGDSTVAEGLVEVPGVTKLSVNGIELVAVVGSGGGEDGDIPCGERVEVAETSDSVFVGSCKGDSGDVLKENGVSVKNKMPVARRSKDLGK